MLYRKLSEHGITVPVAEATETAEGRPILRVATGVRPATRWIHYLYLDPNDFPVPEVGKFRLEGHFGRADAQPDVAGLTRWTITKPRGEVDLRDRVYLMAGAVNPTSWFRIFRVSAEGAINLQHPISENPDRQHWCGIYCRPGTRIQFEIRIADLSIRQETTYEGNEVFTQRPLGTRQLRKPKSRSAASKRAGKR